MSILRRLSYYKIKGTDNKIEYYIDDFFKTNEKCLFLKKNFNLKVLGNNNKIYLPQNISINKKISVTVLGNNNKLIIKNNLSVSNSNIQIKGNNNSFFIGNFAKLINTTIEAEGDNNKLVSEDFVKYEHTLISLFDNNNLFKIATTKNFIKDAKIYIEEGGLLQIGKNSGLQNGDLHIVVNNGYNITPKIIIGDNVRIAKSAIIRASDGHALLDKNTGMPINPPKDVIIGNNVWIASRCTILKGTEIPNGSMVAACALVNKKFDKENIMLAGTPAKVIREDILWDINNYRECMEKLEKEKLYPSSSSISFSNMPC